MNEITKNINRFNQVLRQPDESLKKRSELTLLVSRLKRGLFSLDYNDIGNREWLKNYLITKFYNRQHQSVNDLIHCGKFFSYAFDSQVNPQTTLSEIMAIRDFNLRGELYETFTTLKNISLEKKINIMRSMPIKQAKLIAKCIEYLKKRMPDNSRYPDINEMREGLCAGFTGLNMYYCFLGKQDQFFRRLYRIITADVPKFEDLTNKKYIDLREEAKEFEHFINDVLSLHNDIRTGIQGDPIVSLRFLSDQKTIHRLKSHMQISALFKKDNDSFNSLEDFMIKLLTSDKTKRKYIQIHESGAHVVGIFYDKGCLYLYDSNDAFPPDKQALDEKNAKLIVKYLIKIMTTLFDSNANSICLGINVISDEDLEEISNLQKSENVNNLLLTGVDSKGCSPLFLASLLGFIQNVEKSIAAGADINHANKNVTTPLFIAAQNGHLEIIKKLIEKGAKVNQAENNGVNPLCIAAENGHLEIVKKLIDAGADVNHRSNNCVTSMILAVHNGNVKIVKLLIDAGADVNQVLKDGNTPLKIAFRNGHTDVVELLKKAGAVIE